MRNFVIYTVLGVFALPVLLHINPIEAADSTRQAVAVENKKKPGAQTKQKAVALVVVQGKKVSKRFYSYPEVLARKAKLVDRETKKAVPKKWASVAVKRGAAPVKDREGKVAVDKNGKVRKKKYALVTVKANSKMPPGKYDLVLLDKKGKPVSYTDKKTNRVVKAGPKKLTVKPASSNIAKADQQAISQKSSKMVAGSTQEPKVAISTMSVPQTTSRVTSQVKDERQVVATNTDSKMLYASKAKVGGRASGVDNIRTGVEGVTRADQIADRMNKFGKWAALQDFGSLGREAKPWGAGPALLGFVSETRLGLISQGGKWPANSGGVLGPYGNAGGNDIGTPSLQSGSSSRSSVLGKEDLSKVSSRSSGDPRLMAKDGEDTGSSSSGGSSSGGTTSSGGATESSGSSSSGESDPVTSTVTTSDADTTSSDGSSSQSSTVTVSNSNGTKLVHTVSQNTTASGSTTSRQSVSYTDKNGNTTNYNSSTNNNGNTTTSCSGPMCTPSPDSAGCMGPACEAFKQWNAAFMGHLDKAGIRNMQGDAGSMMQPVGDGTGRTGSLRQLDQKQLVKEKLNPYILHDNAGSGESGAPQVNTGPRIGGQTPDTLIDPPRDEGECAGQDPGCNSPQPIR